MEMIIMMMNKPLEVVSVAALVGLATFMIRFSCNHGCYVSICHGFRNSHFLLAVKDFQK